MSRNTLLILIALILCTPLAAAGTYSGGTGDPNKPYLIEEPNDIIEMSETADDWDRYFLMTADVNMIDYTFTTAVIAPDTNSDSGFQGTPFGGTFDGAGYKISNLTIDTAGVSNDFLGLFGRLRGKQAQVKNLGLTAPYIYSPGSWYVGPLAADVFFDDGITIVNCSTEDAVICAKQWIGGLIGYSYGDVIDCHVENCSVTADPVLYTYNYCIGGMLGENHGNVTNCYSTGVVAGGVFAGGLIGGAHMPYEEVKVTGSYSTCLVSGKGSVGGLIGLTHHDYEIRNCFATGDVIVTGNGAGGLVGENSGCIIMSYSTGNVQGPSYLGGLVGGSFVGSIIYYCYATGDVIGTSEYIGGLIGEATMCPVRQCYSTGLVAGATYTGGLIGGSQYPDILNVESCFWDKQASGQTSSLGGTGLTTEQMQTVDTFTDAGWDFVGEDVNGTDDFWRMCVDDIHYPHLWWQYSTLGDFDCPDGVGLEDILMLADYWLEEELEPLQSPDATGDGKVNLDDFAITSRNYLTQ